MVCDGPSLEDLLGFRSWREAESKTCKASDLLINLLLVHSLRRRGWCSTILAIASVMSMVKEIGGEGELLEGVPTLAKVGAGVLQGRGCHDELTLVVHARGGPQYVKLRPSQAIFHLLGASSSPLDRCKGDSGLRRRGLGVV